MLFDIFIAMMHFYTLLENEMIQFFKANSALFFSTIPYLQVISIDIKITFSEQKMMSNFFTTFERQTTNCFNL